MVKRNSVAIIPARGGSKRIPDKNIIDFMGLPMITWTIRAALESNLFERVIVSTDSESIRQVSIKGGAEVPFMRERYADDYTPVSQVTLDALLKVEDHYGETYDTVVQLMPSCPLRDHKTVTQSYENFTKNNAEFQISCFKFGWMNPWWAFRLNETGKPTALFDEAIKKRSQDLDSLYCPTGAVWIAKGKNLKDAHTFYGRNHIFFPIDWKEAVDIDDEYDLEMAKATYVLIKEISKKNANRMEK